MLKGLLPKIIGLVVLLGGGATTFVAMADNRSKAPQENISSVEKDDFVYDINMDTGNVSISCGIVSRQTIEIPATVLYEEKLYKVKEIKDMGCTGIYVENIIISEGIEVIGVKAFNGTISGNFQGYVSIPSTVREIKSRAFQNNAFKEIRFEEDSKLEYIREYAFAGVNGASNSSIRIMDDIYLPDSVRVIEKSAFAVVAVNEINIGKTANSKLEKIETDAFAYLSVGKLETSRTLNINIFAEGEITLEDHFTYGIPSFDLLHTINININNKATYKKPTLNKIFTHGYVEYVKIRGIEI